MNAELLRQQCTLRFETLKKENKEKLPLNCCWLYLQSIHKMKKR